MGWKWIWALKFAWSLKKSLKTIPYQVLTHAQLYFTIILGWVLHQQNFQRSKFLSLIGYVCTLSDVLTNGCCNQNGNSTHRFHCLTCRENRCCQVFEHCISCCLQPHKVILLPLDTCYLTHLSSVRPFSTPWKHGCSGSPASIYLLKVTMETVEQGVKYVQS